jgi:hypothetical protein
MPVTKKIKENSLDILMRSYDITENAKNMQQVHNVPNIFLKEASKKGRAILNYYFTKNQLKIGLTIAHFLCSIPTKNVFTYSRFFFHDNKQ